MVAQDSSAILPFMFLSTLVLASGVYAAVYFGASLSGSRDATASSVALGVTALCFVAFWAWLLIERRKNLQA